MASAQTIGSSQKYSESQTSDRHLKNTIALDVQWQPYIAGVVTTASGGAGGTLCSGAVAVQWVGGLGISRT